MARTAELYGYNVYSDGVLVAIADTRARARKVARQVGGTYRHVHTAAPRAQHARSSVSAYRSNPESQSAWKIEQRLEYGWGDSPWTDQGDAMIFDTADDAEREVLEIIAEAEATGVDGFTEGDFRIVEVRQNPCWPRITYIVSADRGRREKWSVRRQGAKRASKRFKLKAAALEYARDKALDHRYSQIVVYGRDGEVADVKYYGALAKTESRLGIGDY